MHAQDETRPLVQDLVRRLLHRPAPDGSAPSSEPTGPAGPDEPTAAITPAQAAQVREVALARAHDLDLPDGQARLLADAIVGGLNVAT